MPETNSRGRDLLEMAARLELVVNNEGSVTTYRRSGFGESIPDITFTLSNWYRGLAVGRVWKKSQGVITSTSRLRF